MPIDQFKDEMITPASVAPAIRPESSTSAGHHIPDDSAILPATRLGRRDLAPSVRATDAMTSVVSNDYCYSDVCANAFNAKYIQNNLFDNTPLNLTGGKYMRPQQAVQFAIICVVSSILASRPLSAQPPAATQPTVAPTSGVPATQTLSSFIKGAVAKAVPLLGTVLDLIWGNSNNPGASSNSKTNLQAAANNPATQQTLSKQVISSFQTQLTPVNQVAAELKTINSFLDPSVRTTEQLIVIRTKLKVPAGAAIDWTGIKNAWQLAKVQIGKVKTVPDGDIAAVRDAYLSDRLNQIKAANDSIVIQIDQDIMGTASIDLMQDVAALLTTLANMTAVSGYEFAVLQTDIQDIAIWARGAAGSGPKVDQSAFASYMKAALPPSKVKFVQ